MSAEKIEPGRWKLKGFESLNGVHEGKRGERDDGCYLEEVAIN